MSLFEILSLAFSLSTTVAIIIAVVQIKINRKQLYIATITKCINDYRALGRLRKENQDAALVFKYVDLVNEELFYIQHRYIPLEVSREWIDGMIDYMPINDDKGEILNSKDCLEYLAMVHDKAYGHYPRVIASFEIKGSYNFPIIYTMEKQYRAKRIAERKRLINEILNNIRNFQEA